MVAGLVTKGSPPKVFHEHTTRVGVLPFDDILGLVGFCVNVRFAIHTTFFFIYNILYRNKIFNLWFTLTYYGINLTKE